MIYDLTEIRSAGRDDDGTIATNSVQISTQPANGSVIKLPDDTVSYVPGIGFAGIVGANAIRPYRESINLLITETIAQLLLSKCFQNLVI